jgi:hypothetical protein
MVTRNFYKYFILAMLFYPFNIYAQRTNGTMQDSLLIYNKMLSEREMREDLDILYAIHKAANSGLYVYHTEEQVDSVYNKAFKSIERPLRVIDFYKIILNLADYEGSVHNYTAPDQDLLNFLNRQKAFFPFSLRYINKQIIFDNRTAAIPPGSRIISVNGVSDEQLMRSFYKYYPTDGSNTTRKLSASVDKSFGINYLLEYGLFDEYTVEYSRPNSKSIEKARVPAVTLPEREANIKNRYSAPISDLLDFKIQAPYSFRMLDPLTGLLNLRWFGMVSGREDPGFEPYVQFLDSVFTHLDKNNVRSLIIDVRNNPGGSDPTFEQPMMYLSDKTFKENENAHIIFDPQFLPYENYFWGVSTTAQLDSVTLEMGKKHLKDRFPVLQNKISWQNQKYNPTYYPKSPIFREDLYLLINENTASAASHFASLVRAYVKNVTIIGVETAGGYYVHNGHFPLVYQLPNSKIKTQFSIVNVVQDAPKKDSQPIGHGIMPDYEVWQTLDDFLKQKDTQMEFTLKYLKK